MIVFNGDDTVSLSGPGVGYVDNGDDTVTVTGVVSTTYLGDDTAVVGLPSAGAGPVPVVDPVPVIDDVDPFPLFEFPQVVTDLYDQLPAIYRTLDGVQEPSQPLLRWLTGVTAQLGHVFGVVEAVDFEPADSREYPSQAKSRLADPDAAVPAWLPWIGQLLGVRVNRSLPLSSQRDQIRGATSGFRGGTKGAIAAAARSALTGAQFVQVYDHSVNDPGDGGGEFDVLIVTRSQETPSSAAVLQAVVDKGAKPAGVILRTRAYTTDWTTFQTANPTWAAINGRSWAQIQETGVPNG